MRDTDDFSPPDDEPFRLSSSRLVLQTLLEAGNLDRVVAEARRFLEQDPEDSTAHFYLVLALTDLKRRREAQMHLDHLLAAEPEAARTHLAAVCLYASAEHWSKVQHHVNEGLRIDPDHGFFHRFAAIASLKKLDLAAARRHIARARQLDPDDADTANLYIRIHGATETTAADAVKRLDDYRAALRLDPHNAALHNSIGDLHLNELADPLEAERAYREALRIEPDNPIYQQDLFQAVAARSITYRLFSIPSRTFAWLYLVTTTIARQPWRIIFLVIGAKAVAAFLIWLLLATLIFWPGGKAYEWLLVSEIRRGSAASDTELRLWFWLRRWPRWVRFALFLGFNLGLWGACFALLGLPIAVGYLIVAVFSAVHLLFVSIAWAIRRGRANSALQRRERRRTPPPLPVRQ